MYVIIDIKSEFELLSPSTAIAFLILIVYFAISTTYKIVHYESFLYLLFYFIPLILIPSFITITFGTFAFILPLCDST